MSLISNQNVSSALASQHSRFPLPSGNSNYMGPQYAQMSVAPAIPQNITPQLGPSRPVQSPMHSVGMGNAPIIPQSKNQPDQSMVNPVLGQVLKRKSSPFEINQNLRTCLSNQVLEGSKNLERMKVVSS